MCRFVYAVAIWNAFSVSDIKIVIFSYGEMHIECMIERRHPNSLSATCVWNAKRRSCVFKAKVHAGSNYRITLFGGYEHTKSNNVCRRAKQTLLYPSYTNGTFVGWTQSYHNCMSTRRISHILYNVILCEDWFLPKSPISAIGREVIFCLRSDFLTEIRHIVNWMSLFRIKNIIWEFSLTMLNMLEIFYICTNTIEINTLKKRSGFIIHTYLFEAM